MYHKLLQVHTVSYNHIIISDHAPVSLELSFPEKTNSHCPWCFNPLLLSDEAFVNYTSSEIDLFVSTNVTPGASASLIWETFKALSGSQGKQRRDRQSQLLTSITKLEDEYASSPSDTYKKATYSEIWIWHCSYGKKIQFMNLGKDPLNPWLTSQDNWAQTILSLN